MKSPSVTELPPPPPGKSGWPWTEESPQLHGLMPDGLSWPQVSVVTPSYNQAQFLEETIRSVLLQGYPNLEYFILDGGSTDGSVEIIQKYEPWLAYWVSEKDDGQADAIRRGFAKCGGDIIAWLNSDDIYMTHAIRRAVESFSEKRELGGVYGECEYIDGKGHSLKMYSVQDFALENFLWRGNPIAQPAMFMRRSIYEAVGGIDVTFSFAMDYDLWLRLGLEAPLQRIPHLIAKYRLWEDSKTTTGTAKSRIEVLRALDKFYAEPNVPLKLRKQEACAYAFAWFHASLGSFVAGDVAKSREQLQECLAFSLDRCSQTDWLRGLPHHLPIEQMESYMRDVVYWVKQREALPDLHREAWSLACQDRVWLCYESAEPSLVRTLIHRAVRLWPRCIGNVGLWKIYFGLHFRSGAKVMP